MDNKMEILIFCGIQATGKTSFYKEMFFKTHLRILLDQLKTRNREKRFIETCLLTHQPFVVDNTNLTKNDIAERNYWRIVHVFGKLIAKKWN